MLQVRHLMIGDQRHDTGPYPIGCFQALGVLLSQLRLPVRARLASHLASMRFAYYRRQEASGRYGLVLAKSIEIEFQVLRHELSQHDRLLGQGNSHHAFAEVRREIAGSLDYSLCMVLIKITLDAWRLGR